MKFLRAIRVAIHVPLKALSFFMFGLGSLVLATVVFPTLRLFVHPGWRFRRAMRVCIRFVFSLFINFMRLLGLVRIKVEDRDRLNRLRGTIVVANHPTLIDVAILFAHIPQANCIVRGDLWRNPVTRGVVSRLFISQNQEFEDTAADAARSLDEGDNLIIFPEGTRSVRGKVNVLKRSAAQIAVRSGHDVLCIRVACPDSTGLAKHDSMLDVPEGGTFRYRFTPLDILSVTPYAGMEPARAARALTKEIAERIVGNSQNEVEHGHT